MADSQLAIILGSVFGAIIVIVAVGFTFWWFKKGKSAKDISYSPAKGKLTDEDEYKIEEFKIRSKQLEKNMRQKKDEFTWEDIDKINSLASEWPINFDEARNKFVNFNYLMSVRDGWYNQAPTETLVRRGFLLNTKTDSGLLKIVPESTSIGSKKYNMREIRSVKGTGIPGELKFDYNDETIMIFDQDESLMQIVYILLHRYSKTTKDDNKHKRRFR